MKRKAPFFAAVIGLIVSVIMVIGVSISKDNIIINEGIREFNTIRNGCIAGVCVCATLSLVGFFMMKRSEQTEISDEDIRDEIDKDALDEATRNELYRELEHFGQGKWSRLPEIRTMLAQFDSIDEYQAELGRLLEQSDYLKGKPAEIVQRVEDCMYINIRKLLNYMRIVQSRDLATMKSKAAECLSKNAELLKKTDDFVVAVVGYVNGDLAPGEEQKTKDYVDSYMFVVLEAIDLPETYLR